MNVRRILGLGFAIGLLLNVVGVLGNGILLREPWANAIPMRPEQAMTGWLSLLISLLSDFVFGPSLVWLYAALLPRFGAGLATASRAAVLIWILGVAVPYVGIVRIGWLPLGVVIGTSAVALVGMAPAVWLTVRYYPGAVDTHAA